LAESGLLNGRRAATHWAECDELARRYPLLSVDPGVLLVDALLIQHPIPSRGVAMVSLLLGDGTGPLYRSGSSDDLDVALREAIAQL
jgi:hypothetical protein